MHSQMRRNRGKVCGERCRDSMPSPGALLSPHLHVFTNLKLSKPCPFGFLWRLHYRGMTDDQWPLLIDSICLSPLPRESGGWD